jgi:DNA-directed RNA polymerase subunit RPC12/RpoP
MLWSMMEISIDCPHCDSPVHVDGPYLKLECGKCHSGIDFPKDVWKSVLEDVREDVSGYQKGEGSNSNIFGHFNMRMTCGRLDPYCIKCKRDFDMKDEYTEPATITCPDCGTVSPVFPASDWFREAVPGATLIVGAWPEGKSGPESDEKKSQPVAYSCPQCGGSLMINGEERLIQCQYCSTNIYLPDDLWLTLHPAKTKTRWFIGF